MCLRCGKQGHTTEKCKENLREGNKKRGKEQ